METRLFTKQELLGLINIEKYEEAISKLTEKGWQDPDCSDYDAMEKTLSDERARTFKELESFAPEKNLVRVFRLKYDYHNVKAILKAKALAKPCEDILSPCGNIQKEKMYMTLYDETYTALSPIMKKAVLEAIDIIARTQDPFYSDLALDSACFYEMVQLAKASESEFLAGYVKLRVDAVNLCTAIRLRRRGLSYEYLKQSFIPGGSINKNKLLTELTPDAVKSALEKTPLETVADIAGSVIRGDEMLTSLDIAIDNALMDYIKNAKYIGLGEQPLVAYAAAKEAEITALRIVFSGRLAGLSPGEIKERLRDTYV